MLAQQPLEDVVPEDKEENAFKGRLLCVDDEAPILMSLKRVFRRAGHTITTANSAAEGLAYLEENAVDVVISDMRMPEMDGNHFLAEVARKWPDTVRMLLTGYSDIDSTVGAINNGSIYRYIAKPWDDTDLQMCVQRALESKHDKDERRRLDALTIAQNEELQQLNSSLEEKVAARTRELQESNNQIEQAYVDSIAIFSRIIGMREGESTAHGERVAEAADMVAAKLELTEEQRRDIRYAALLHDIGKIGLSDDLLKTPYDKLTDDQKQLFQQHSTNGEAILVTLGPLANAAAIIRAHHEQVGGGGYPDGLSGDNIPIGARILTVVNEFDDLLSGALVGVALDSASAIRYLESHRGKRYDTRVVDAFLKINESIVREESIKKELILHIDNIEPGMTLAEDVYLRENVLMLRSGQVMTATFIEKYQTLKSGDNDAMLLKIRT